MRDILWCGFILAGLAAAGCADNQQRIESHTSDVPQDGSNAAVARSATAATGGDAMLAIPLELKSWAGIQEWVAGQRGKVVVIDVWSTFCHPCLKEFPHFVELHQHYGDRIACASLSIDFYGGEGNTPQEVQPRVLKFLTEQGASMRNFISSDPDETVLDQIGAAAIPVSLVYDRDGQLHTTFSNDKNAYGPEGFNYADDIVPLVEQLLQPGS